jgi:nucleotide-binding universal stress UspA family protein
MKLLVPIDFTAVTENALSYAIQLEPAKEVLLFHVISSNGDIAKSNAQLEFLAEKYRPKFSGNISVSVKEGNIFDHIGEEALDKHCDLIVMGTHGISGMQHFLGSRAMKVITNSKTPYIVVQKKPFRPVKKILVPVDFTKENKQVIPFLSTIAKLFGAKVLLTAQEPGKDEFIKNKIDNNILYYKNALASFDVTPDLLPQTFNYDKRHKSIVEVAVKNDADMVVTAIDPKVDVADYIMGVEEQKIVANEEQIPVLCINIRNFTKFTGSIFEGSA